MSSHSVVVSAVRPGTSITWYSDVLGTSMTRIANMLWGGAYNDSNIGTLVKAFEDQFLKDVTTNHAIAQTANTNKFMLTLLRNSKLFKEVTSYYNLNSGNYVHIFEYVKKQPKNKVKQKENS